MKHRRLHREPDAQRRFVAADCGFQQRAAAGVFPFGDGEDRRQYRRARVVHGADVRVVEVAGVGEGAVDEGGADGVHAIAVQQHGTGGVAAELERILLAFLPRQLRAHGNDPQQVEHQRFHPVHNGRRGVLQPEIRCPLREISRGLVFACCHQRFPHYQG